MSLPDSIKTIYFDESGQTGLKLLDPQQRYFSVASTDLTQDEASDIIQKCFPSRTSPDLKFKTLIANWRNFDGLIKFAEIVGSDPSRHFCFVIDKRFSLLCRIVDWLVEPYWHARGFDFYRDDYARSYANLFDMAFEIDGDEHLQLEVTSIFENFVRAPSRPLLSKMQARYRDIAINGTNNVSRFMQHVADGVEEFERHWKLDSFKDSNDIHVTNVVTSVAWWRSRHSMDFSIIHDKSNHFFARREIWELITDMSASEAKIVVGEKSIQLPLRVRDTTPGDSAVFHPLKVCDLIAGFHTKAKSRDLTKDQRQVIGSMIGSGMSFLHSDCIERGENFATGMPPRAHGPDAVDQIAKSIYKR